MLILLISLTSNSTTFANTNKKYFVVSAYYSPLKNQNFYLKWNYEDECRLNGMWIAWKSWKKVFSWMLAAPKNYKFWTKIYLKWLWIGNVQDRWWAIVNAWNRGYKYDRLDVWMWKWDEWLRRALYWWKRTIKWNVVSSNIDTSIDISKIPDPFWAIKSLEYQKNLFNISIWSKSQKKDIISLQEKLKEMELYKWEINGNYANIINIVYNYQIKNNIIDWNISPWAWYTGPKTRRYLKKDYFKYLEKKAFEEKRKKFLKDKFEELWNISSKKAKNRLYIIWKPKFWEVSYRVRELQIFLKNLWYFNYKDTAIFGNITKNGLISYQINKKIISGKDEKWAWYFWPKTKNAIKKDLENIILNKLISEEKDISIDELKRFWFL